MKSESNTPLESRVVEWLLGLIESDDLSAAIGGRDEIENVVRSSDQPNVIRSFSIDYVSRLASSRAAAHVLSQLDPLQLVSVDKSISLTSTEVLRPDIICFNPETRTLIVFEVKRASATERQTVTELAGYEQELRNMLPFLGSFDICFVVVATEWTPLLDHAVGSLNAWSGKQCLGLRLNVAEDSFGLTCHLPEAWHLRGSVFIPPQAMQTIDLCLFEEETDPEELWPPRSVMTAMDVIARAGDRYGSHGFMMLWRDVNGFGNGNWSLTLCAIDPLAMYSWCRSNGQPHRESETSRFLDAEVKGSTELIPSVVYRMAREAFPVLKGKYDPQFEGAFGWHEKVLQYRSRGVPVRFDFWGSLGDYAREFVCSRGVRDQFMPFLEVSELDWTDPDVAVPLIEMLTGHSPFPGGLIRCSDAFAVGRALGMLEIAASNFDQGGEYAKKFEPLVRWAELEALRFAIEMKQIYDVSQEVTEPMPALTNASERRLSAARSLGEWVMNSLIGDDHSIHQELFYLGSIGAAPFSGWIENSIGLLDQKHKEHLLSMCRKVVGELITLAADNENPMNKAPLAKFISTFSAYVAVGDAKDYESLQQSLASIPDDLLIEEFENIVLPAADSLIPVVLHTVAPLQNVLVDWDWLKAGVQATFDSGFHWPTVIRAQDGTIGAGRLDEKVAKLLMPIADPSKEVYFLNESAVSHVAAKITWEELMAIVAGDR